MRALLLAAALAAQVQLPTATASAFPCTEQGIRDAIAVGVAPRTFCGAGPTRSAVELDVPTNTPIDTSGNGRFDLVIVDGDFNGNGAVSMQDLEDAARALTALAVEPKEIRVTGPHVYGVADVPPPDALSRSRLLGLDSNTTLECEAQAVLEGWDEAVPGQNAHVVGNRDDYNGNRGIRIRGCTIDGGQPESSYGAAIGFRTAVYFNACDGCTIENSTLRNTFHACFYTRHGQGSFSLGNRYENCGGTFLDRPGATQGQPCLYAFAESGRVTRGVYSIGDVMLGCGAPAFNVRRADASASISDIHLSDATIEDPVLPARGIHWGCFNLRGSSAGNLASEITCRRAAGFYTGWGGGALGSYDHESTTHDALITDVDFEEMNLEVIIGPWSTDIVLSDLSISSASAGIAIHPPNRGLVIENSTICADRGGIVFDTEAGAPTGVIPGDPAESTTIRNTTILCSDGDPAAWPVYDGIEIRGGGSRMELVNVDVSGVTGNAVRVHDPAQTGIPFELSIRGGSFAGAIRAEDDASIEIDGGIVERIVAADRATITLIGSDFVCEEGGSPVLVGYGDIDTGFEGRVTGVLADGSPLDVTASNAGSGSRLLLREPRPTLWSYHGTLEFELSPFAPVSVTGTGVASVGRTGTLWSVGLLDGISGSAVLPTLTTAGGAVSVRVTAALGPGTIDLLTTAGPAERGVLPVSGIFRLCMFFPGCSSSLDLPLTVNGTAGVGIGGTISFGGPVHRTQAHEGWLLGTAMLTDDLPSGPTTVLTRTGFLHGPESASSTAAATSGVVQLISPAQISVTGDPGNTKDALFTTLRLRFVPEAGSFLGLGSGATVLLALARHRARR